MFYRDNLVFTRDVKLDKLFSPGTDLDRAISSPYLNENEKLVLWNIQTETKSRYSALVRFVRQETSSIVTLSIWEGNGLKFYLGTHQMRNFGYCDQGWKKNGGTKIGIERSNSQFGFISTTCSYDSHLLE